MLEKAFMKVFEKKYREVESINLGEKLKAAGLEAFFGHNVGFIPVW